LAAKVLRSLLRIERNLEEWEHVLNSKIWDIPKEKSSIFPILKFSYQSLPSHLKRCFAYCSLFPKDYEFDEKELVLLWMAEGLVQETSQWKIMVVSISVIYLGDHFFNNQAAMNHSLSCMI
jgi:hypothetical protein